MATLICPECGLVELSGTTRCPDCGLTALDDRDFTNRNAIDEAIALRRQLAQPRWTAAALVLAGAAALLVGTALGKDPRVGEALAYPSLIGALLIGRAVGRRHLTPAWRAAIASHRHTVRDRALTRAYWTSTTVIALTICLVFVGVEIAVGIDALAFQRGDELTRPWRIATSAFSHAGPLHLLGNVVALLAFGLAIDLRIGRLATATILAVSAIAAALVQARLSPEPMVGFSGAIYGLIGATLALMPTRPTLLALRGSRIPMPTWLWSLFMIPLLTFTAWVDHKGHVAWGAHLGGFIAGFLVALPMRRIPTTTLFERLEDKRRERIERMASR